MFRKYKFKKHAASEKYLIYITFLKMFWISLPLCIFFSKFLQKKLLIIIFLCMIREIFIWLTYMSFCYYLFKCFKSFYSIQEGLFNIKS